MTQNKLIELIHKGLLQVTMNVHGKKAVKALYELDSILAENDVAEMMAGLLLEFKEAVECNEIGFIDYTGRIYKETVEALAAYEAAKTNNGWMPIETAPKDGSQFLAYIPDSDFSGVCQGYCMDDGHFIPLFGEDAIEPTHWMRLPQPPTSETENE